ncbi:plasmid transfer protein TraA [Streptomyces sp. H27-H1]|uniref:plasmid transfer protein TraA n=1 Tax=Streptomyces sp. H27-H1 TaxID=2996461 RepID=UPI00226F2B86|nr:plasmid transfer protein TraA [Streptomyces sp. H27-H1]MCY0931181.1 plasmid transfer protein TraA [Streptomyces sp. H27-H1]
MSAANGGTQHFANGVRSSTSKNPSTKGGTSKTKHGPSFSFGPNINVNSTRTTSSGGRGGQPSSSQSAGGNYGRSQLMLPDPSFGSAAELREYCNTLRAFGVHASIEVTVAAEILQAALSQAKGTPQDNIIQHKIRARRVARKLKKAGESLADAAANAAATYAAFQREYADIITARPQGGTSSARRPFQY